MGEIFLTSDTHFMHSKSFLWKPRGFSSVEEMNEAIIERWNRTVPKNGITYLLGDTMLNDNAKGIECLKRLNGKIFLIFGNHETEARRNLIFTECMHKVEGGWYALVIRHGKQSIYLSHYPTLTANYDEKRFSQHMVNMHGHTHQQVNFLNPENPFMYHVGLDSHNCTPVHIEEALADIRAQWDKIGNVKFPSSPEDLTNSKIMI